MTNEQLRAVMRFHLDNFNDEGVDVTDDTLHKEVLSDSDGFGAANSKALYKGAIRWTLARADKRDPDWPREWMDLSVTQLSLVLLESANAEVTVEPADA
jgi:hypothetical protein